MSDTYFNTILQQRDLLDADVGDFPFRDDGLLLLEAVDKYVGTVLALFYKADEDVQADTELQGWAKDCVGPASIKGFPHSLETLAQLQDVVTNAIFTATTLHAAVNFTQGSSGAVIPNMPGALFKPPPKTKHEVDKEFILDMLPPQPVAIVQLAVVLFLSQPSDDLLGSLDEELFTSEAFKSAVHAWQADLVEVQNTLNDRTIVRQRRRTYQEVLPDQTPNSTAI